MTATDIRDNIMHYSKYNIKQEKLTSLIHRIKVKDNPNEKLFNGVKKLLPSDFDLEEIKEFCESIDFDSLGKNKHGGRGKDKSDRRPHGSVQREKERKQEEHDDYWQGQAELGCGSWVEPYN